MSRLWQARLVADAAAARRAEAVLEPHALATSRFEAAPGGRLWQLEVLFGAEPDRDLITGALEPDLVAQLRLEPLPELDWIAQGLRDLPPVRAGRFHVHGAHHPPHPSPGVIDLRIEAGAAFGSGQHESTRGCLLALDALARRIRPRAVLDLGCGSGVLALAAARAWRCRVRASDIDATAVAVTRENARRNRLGGLVRTVRADRLGHPVLAAEAPYDLILANILARPLAAMASPLAGALAGRGVLVLSGLLAAQEPFVLAAYRLVGLRLRRRIALNGWHTLVLTRSGDPTR